jgi:3-hydroxybutyryl-CoA dehydrogenase
MKNVSVIGAGTMGHALALTFALGGYQVTLNDISQEILQQAKRLNGANLDTLSEVGFFDISERSVVLEERISYTTDLALAVAKADLVIEAIVEDAEAKKRIFTKLDRLSPSHAIMASNTSYLNIFQFVETKRPGKLVITHWFTPPHIIPLVEIVPGPETTLETLSTVKEVIESLGKQTIVLKKFLPGFIANRLQSAITLEVYNLIDSGYATAEEIDRVAKASFGMRMPILGLVKRLDSAGLEQIQRSLRNKSYYPPEVRGRSEILDELISKGRLGVKSGKGFYDYGGLSTEEILRERDLKLLKLKKFLTEIGELN